MSGDLRAKKNTRLLNKTGGIKKESPKSALNLQTPSCDDENVGFTKVCFKLWVFYLFCKEGKEMVVSFLQ